MYWLNHALENLINNTKSWLDKTHRDWIETLTWLFEIELRSWKPWDPGRNGIHGWIPIYLDTQIPQKSLIKDLDWILESFCSSSLGWEEIREWIWLGFGESGKWGLKLVVLGIKSFIYDLG